MCGCYLNAYMQSFAPLLTTNNQQISEQDKMQMATTDCEESLQELV
jgi:hypothetical protein